VENSHVEYKIWVNDVDTGLEWYVYRRFSEIHNFRETIVAIWPLFGRINFPPRRLSLTSSVKVANERLPVLEQFLRTVYSIVSIQPLTHVSTRAIYSALQDILDVTFRNDGIRATMEQNREFFLNANKVTESQKAEEEESVVSSRAMSSESGQGGRSDVNVDSATLPQYMRISSTPPTTPVKECANVSNGCEQQESCLSSSGDSLMKYGMLMEAAATSSSRPRRHSLFGDDGDDIRERLSSVDQPTNALPPPPPRKDTINSADVEIEKAPDFVALRSPSGLSPSAGGRKRISSLSRTHLPKFDKLPSFDIFEQQNVQEDEDDIVECGSDDSRTCRMTNSSSLSLGDRPRPASLNKSSDQDNTSHPPAYSRVLSKRLEVFVHWVLQVPTFRHIIDPFVKKYRNKILEWELDRTFILNEELVYDRLKFIAEFIDNLQEVLLEGLSADMDSISTYFVSKQCDSNRTSANGTSSNKNISTTSTNDIYYIRNGDDHAIDRSTNRGRSYSVNDGRMSNVVIAGVDLDLLYRKVIRRQVEYEIYFPSRDAIDTMMSRQFGSIDDALERKCNILKHKPQSFFGISVEHMSPSSWEAAITAFGRISAVYTLPADKLDALVVAAKMIPDIFEKEHSIAVENLSPSKNGVEENKQSSLGADDMLPIFIYCLVMSSIPFTKMQSLVHELDFICDTQSRYSEVGYFVTTFQASIQHILHMDEVHGETLECE